MFGVSREVKLFVLLVLLLTTIKLVVSVGGWHVDIVSNAGWGEYIYYNGTKNFYTHNVWRYAWPTQPPLVSLTYGFSRQIYAVMENLFIRSDLQLTKLPEQISGMFSWWSGWVRWWSTNWVSPEFPYLTGYLMMIKFWPILADAVIAGITYLICRKVWVAFVYLLSPFSWYLSAYWGQYDAVSTALALGAFVLLGVRGKKLFWSPVLVTLAVLMKPTVLPILPLYGWIFFQHRGNKQVKVLGVLLSVFLVMWSFGLFDIGMPELLSKVFQKTDMRLAGSAFNFWRGVLGQTQVDQSSIIAGIPGYVWGYIPVIAVYGYLVTRKWLWSLPRIIFGVWVVAMTAFLFLPNMLERYAYLGVVCGLIMTIWYRDIFKYWLLSSLIFWVSLYYGWWFPVLFEPLKLTLEYANALLPRILSLMQVGLFLLMVKRVASTECRVSKY